MVTQISPPKKKKKKKTMYQKSLNIAKRGKNINGP